MWTRSNRWLMELFPLAVIVAVALIVSLWQWWRRHVNAKNPITCITAEVVDKRMTTSRSRRGYDSHTYYVTFRPDDGEDVEFQVGEADYRAYRWKDRGPLSYRTWEFISFRPERRTEGDIPVAFSDEEE